MLDVDRVWARVSQLPEFRAQRLADLIIQTINLNFTLTTGQVSAQTPVNLPAGMVVLGVTAGASKAASLATAVQKPGLEMFAVAVDYQATGRSIIGPSIRGIGSGVFGVQGDQFPAKEMVIPIQGSLLYTVENLTTDTITVTFAHHGLVPNAIG